MTDLIKKLLLTGVGLAAMTKNKIDQLSKDLVEKGDISEKEGRELVDDLLKKSEEARKDTEARMEKVAADMIARLNLPTKADLEQLNARIDRLEESVRGKTA